MVSLLLSVLIQATAPETLRIQEIGSPPPAVSAANRPTIGPSSVRIQTRQGTAEVWLQRAGDSVFVSAWIPDTSYYWGDDFVLSLDLGSERGSAPQDDDFQWYLRRMLDSSVVYRGKAGRWMPPRADPDWRLGTERSGAGWIVDARSGTKGWTVTLRMDAALFKGQQGRAAAIGLRIYDDAPSGWFAWPPSNSSAGPTLVERTPSLWVPVR